MPTQQHKTVGDLTTLFQQWGDYPDKIKTELLAQSAQ